MNDEELVQKATEAKESAYAPYSNFRVGAALLAGSGKVYLGCNVENASSGLTTCAERVAIQTAVCAGERAFEAVALTTDSEEFTPPCGACRQVIWEFAKELKIILSNARGEVKITHISDLFPSPFSSKKPTGQP